MSLNTNYYTRDCLDRIRWIGLTSCFLFYSLLSYAQCPNQITALSGVQTFDCTDVTVTSEGDVHNATFCNGIGPYWVSKFTESSYTFTFSNPVSAVVLSFDGFDNHEFENHGHEEITLEINGLPYAFPNAGSNSTCQPLQAIVNASGNLMAPDCGLPVPLGCYAACKDISIYETINSITIKDIFIGGSTLAGVLFSIHFCCNQCFLSAGDINSPPIILCPGESAAVPPASGTFLTPSSLLQYILYTDPNNITGSILATSNTPNFPFNPDLMQPGVNYYITAIAGTNLNGDVDLNDPCLDFSNTIEILWWPPPTVAFSIPNPDLCIGDCVTVEVNFTGEPPFTLTYTTTFGSPVTKVFQDLTGTIEVCAPVFANPGNLVIQATNLTDNHCACN